MPFPKAYTLKQTLVECGEGCQCPFLRTVCRIFISNTSNGTSTEKLERLTGFKVNEEIDIKLGSGQGDISHIIDRICQKMKPQSTSLCTITFHKTSILLPNETVNFSVHLISWSKLSKPMYLLKPDSCLEYALEYKETGTVLFKQSQIYVAASFYSKAIKYLVIAKSSTDLPEEIKSRIINVLVVCYVNLAACLLKYRFYPEVIASCNDALQLKPDDLKALYRRASSFLALNDLENAEKDISFGMQLNKQNKAFSFLKAELKIKIAEADAQLSKRLKTLFA